MSDAQKLIADVQRQHRRTLSLDDGLSYCQGARAGQCNYLGGDLSDFEAHLAAEIDKALGGLTREQRDADDCDCGHEAHPSFCDDYCVRFDPDKAKSRWVSRWSEARP
ncbi:hypothetical protein BN970_07174 [Mycolicibacterium conceptionense]|uniref:Uncharacterized protein n=1 Tax=Mycolicibacterium conceptionense TaxID=451644 RepID=A0A0U1DZB7_9MYCO|nr:hypothetical protein BN970_07174 [Mycolicibacterium conceptionense]